MIRRIIEFALLVALLIGGYHAWSTGRERSRLEAEFKRLVKATGDFTIGDPTKVHILAIPTGEQLHFAWRIYLPPNYNLTTWLGPYPHGSNQGTKAVEMIGRIRLLEEGGVLKSFDNLASMRMAYPIGDAKMAEFLRSRWSQIVIEQIGTEGVVAIEPDDFFTILRLTIPNELRAEARAVLSSREDLTLIPAFFSFDIGTPKTRPIPLQAEP